MSTSSQPATSRTLHLVLLPGTLTDERVFAPLLSHLVPPTDSSLDIHILEVHDAPNILAAAQQVLAAAPSNFILIGFSLGGLIALQTALLSPQRLCGLILLNTTAAAVPAEHHAARRAQAAWTHQHGADTLIREHLWPLYVSPSNADQATLRLLLATMAETLGSTVFDTQTELALTRPDYRSSLATLTMPTLILGGTEDAINPPPTQLALGHAIPNATLALIDRAGHFALLEQPAALAAHINPWLASLATTCHAPQESTPR